ncbi:hypothetical protein GCM10029976_059450 [Kribbella albertanoniae]|uniref:hypothetical protein n=1 Tax=Kribbella albertanoniae TaxID=1266829 RepID=UPI00192D3DCA|nr:hypothetical protein [Kribbella albertanoniae]
MIYNPPPNWPPPPEGWRPKPGWQPDPSWGPPPPGWKVWLPANSSGRAFGYAYAAAGIVGLPTHILAYMTDVTSTYAVMSGFVYAPIGVAILARITTFRWHFAVYLPVVLVAGLLASEFFVGSNRP